jgi:hypothetical protein
MRATWVTFALGILCCISVAHAQDGAGAMPSAWSFKNNFSIPDAPAYLMLGIESTDILRPETPRDLVLGLSKFRAADGSLALPHALALEFSPLLLTAPDDLTLEAYKRRKYWYASRLSAATIRDSVTGVATRLAAALRITLVDDRTIGTDKDYREDLQVTDLTRQLLELRTQAVDRTQAEAFEKIDTDIDSKASDENLTPEQVRKLKREKKRDWIQAHQNDAPRQTAEEDDRIAELAKEIRRRFTERYWNATVFDVAAGVRGSSPDSTGRDMKLDALAFWASYGIKMGSNSQLVLGFKAGSERDSLRGDLRTNVAGGLRYYLGSAHAKAFAETQLSVAEESKGRTILSAGIEATLGDWVWFNLSAGRLQLGSEPAEVITNFKFKTALPTP